MPPPILVVALCLRERPVEPDFPTRGRAKTAGDLGFPSKGEAMARLRVALEPDPNWTYGELLPLATSKATGETAFAVPNAVRALGGGALDLLERKTVDRGLTSEGFGALAAPALGGIGKIPSGSKLLTFAGEEGAKRLAAQGYPAALEALTKARALHKEGVSEGEIYRATGYHQGPGGQWFFEIPDNGLKLEGRAVRPNQFYPEMNTIHRSPDRAVDPYHVSDAVQHPMLRNVYPELFDKTELHPVPPFNFGMSGAYSPPAGESPGRLYLGGSKPKDMRETVIHELQHGVQNTENAPHGGMPDQFLPAGYKDRAASIQESYSRLDEWAKENNLDPLMVKWAAKGFFENDPAVTVAREKMKELGMWDTARVLQEHETALNSVYDRAHDTYKRLAGEAQARLSSARADLTPAERLANPPFEAGPYGYDVPRERQLVNPPGPVDFEGSLPGYRDGADFTVSGTGGPDSQTVAFRASPGERVTVTPPGGLQFTPVEYDPFAGAQAALPVPRPQDIPGVRLQGGKIILSPETEAWSAKRPLFPAPQQSDWMQDLSRARQGAGAIDRR